MADRYRLARKGDRIPMPGRGPGVLFTDNPEGEALDPLNPWHARLIDDGSVKLIEPKDEPDPEPQAPKVTTPTPKTEGGK